jgi:Neuraminidase (sialidase)
MFNYLYPEQSTMRKASTPLKALGLLAIIIIAVVPTMTDSPNYAANAVAPSESSLVGGGDSLAANGDLTAASGSNRFVAWSDATSGNTEILFRRSTDNGATWKPIVNLSNTTGSSSNPNVLVSDSAVYVVWEDSTPGASDVFVLRSTDNGATWKAVKNLSNNSGDSNKPQIAVSGSNVYVTWEDETPGSLDILLIRSTDNGATWKAVKNLGNITGLPDPPELSVLGANVYVVWYDSSLGNPDILFRRSTDNGATWKAVKNLSNNAGDSTNPQIAVSGSSVFVTWEDNTPGNWDILNRRSNDAGVTWNTIRNLSNNAGSSTSPQLAG